MYIGFWQLVILLILAVLLLNPISRVQIHAKLKNIAKLLQTLLKQ